MWSSNNVSSKTKFWTIIIVFIIIPNIVLILNKAVNMLMVKVTSDANDVGPAVLI
jgi:hypothetical protein